MFKTAALLNKPQGSSYSYSWRALSFFGYLSWLICHHCHVWSGFRGTLPLSTRFLQSGILWLLVSMVWIQRYRAMLLCSSMVAWLQSRSTILRGLVIYLAYLLCTSARLEEKYVSICWLTAVMFVTLSTGHTRNALWIGVQSYNRLLECKSMMYWRSTMLRKDAILVGCARVMMTDK